ncbi:MAG: PilZ domain-containing protein [Terriglobia bacterium]
MPPNMPPVPRRSERRPAIIPVRLVLEAANLEADNSAIATDISTDGVGVRTKLALVPGEWVGYIDKSEFPHAVPSRVVWAREDEDSHWTFAGLEFLPARI